MKRLMTAIIVSTLSLSAYAVEVGPSVDISWEVPATRVDGSALEKSEIDFYTLTCGETITTISAGVAEGNYNLTRAEMIPGPGTYPCAMTVTDVNGLESASSEMVRVTWRLANPSAPNSFQVIIGNF